MTLQEAIQSEISALRKPDWAPGNYITIDILHTDHKPKHNLHGPWIHVWRPKEWDDIDGLKDIPRCQHVLFSDDGDTDWEEIKHDGTNPWEIK